MSKASQKSQITFTEGERDIFAKREFVAVSAWASRHLIVQDGIYKGSPFRLQVSPFLAGPMDAFSNPRVQEVVVCGSLQVGKTLFLYACMGWAMVFRPGIKMLTMPTKDSRNRVVEKKLKPLLRGSPALRKLVTKFKQDAILLRDGTSVELATAESPSQRASITIQDLIVDEEDLYSSSGLSNPLEDFKGRTRSYGEWAKIARACQPKGGEESSIWGGITKGVDQLYCYEVRCPADLCGHSHVMDAANIVIAGNEKDPKNIKARRLARYQCPHCKYQWTDHIRNLAVEKGHWAPYRYTPERGFEPCPEASDAKSVGYHIPAYLSRMVSLSDIAARKIVAEASDDPALKRQYYNDDLALPYTPVEVQTNAEIILSLREAWLPARTVPNGAVALTCGIDVQARGFWFLVRAWMPNMASYIVDYGSLETWEDVAKIVFDTYYPVLGDAGESMPIWRAAIDSGGTETQGVYTRTEEVYMWVRANSNGVAFACKGASHVQSAPVRRVIRERMPHNGRPIPGGLPLYLLDTGNFKTLDFGRLLNPESKQPLRLHGECGQDLAEQLSAEKLVRHNNKLVWEQQGGANHLLDCLMLSAACADASFTPSLPHYLLQLEREKQMQNAPHYAPKRREKQETHTRWG